MHEAKLAVVKSRLKKVRRIVRQKGNLSRRQFSDELSRRNGLIFLAYTYAIQPDTGSDKPSWQRRVFVSDYRTMLVGRVDSIHS